MKIASIKKFFLLWSALSRLSLRMVTYMLRREAKIFLVPRFPDAYRRAIQYRANDFRSLPASSEQPGPGLRAAADFYCHEYRAMARDVSKGVVALNNRTVDFGSVDAIDWNHALPEDGDHQMWRVKLAHMGFLCPMLAEGDHVQCGLAGQLVAHAHATTDIATRGSFKAFWFPYAASHRLLSLGAGLVVARSRGHLSAATDRTLTNFLALNAAFVLDTIEHELCNNHVERNLAGLCLYFTYIAAIPPRLAHRIEADVAYLLNRTLLADGTQVERSPMYQGLSMVSLGVMAEAPFLSDGLRAEIQRHAAASRRAFATLCHPDGNVALFNDSWHGEVPTWHGPPAPDGRTVLLQGGYARLSQGSDVCLLDAGPLGPTWNPGHGHADFLSLEISLGGTRLIVDPGTSRYNNGPDRCRERSAAAHNGPVWEGHEPVEFFGSFKVGRLCAAQMIDPGLLPQGTIAGVFNPVPGWVGRIVRHIPDLGWTIGDVWHGNAPASLRWLIPAPWSVRPAGEHFVLNHGSTGSVAHLQFAGACATMVEPAVCASHYGQTQPAQAVVIRPQPGAEQRLVTWVGRSPPPTEALSKGYAQIDLLNSFIPDRTLR